MNKQEIGIKTVKFFYYNYIRTSYIGKNSKKKEKPGQKTNKRTKLVDIQKTLVQFNDVPSFQVKENNDLS